MKRLIAPLMQAINPMGNPIIVKELRSRMRGARAFVTLTVVLLLFALISYALYKLVIITSTWSYTPLSPQIGQTLFTALAILEMLMICLITPAITAGAISSEHEKLTYEMLLTTPLNPGRILWGKLISALSYIFILIFAAIPMASLVFIYGGVSPRDMLKALIILFCTAIMLGTIGIFLSTLMKRSGRATVISYLFVLGLLGAPTVLYGIVGLLRQAEPPRWLLVPSPISALFSAIAPSTTLGNSSFSMIGGLSMLMSGNIGFISTNSIPRPLYHYTLPLYGLITIVLYLFSTRLIRPARRWRIRARELLMGTVVIVIFAGSVALAFGSTTDRYENISIFAAPTSFPMPVEPFVGQAIAVETMEGLAVSDDEAIQAYRAILSEIEAQGLVENASVVAISRLIYTDPGVPDLPQTNTFYLSDDVENGISTASDEFTFELLWLDDFFAFPPKDVDSAKNVDTLILLGNLNPMKVDSLQVVVSVFYTAQSNENLVITLTRSDGKWEVISTNMIEQSSNNPAPRVPITELPLSSRELGEIYTAAIIQTYVADNPAPEIEISKLYILQTVELANNPTILTDEIQIEISTGLEDMPFQTLWTENRKDLDEGDAIVTLGSIIPRNENSVEVMIDLFLSEENRILITYILENIDGEWQITATGGLG